MLDDGSKDENKPWRTFILTSGVTDYLKTFVVPCKNSATGALTHTAQRIWSEIKL